MSPSPEYEFKALTVSQLAKKYGDPYQIRSDKIGPLPKGWKKITIDEIPRHRYAVGKLPSDCCLHCGNPAGRIMGFCDDCNEAMRCGSTPREAIGIGTGV